MLIHPKCSLTEMDLSWHIARMSDKAFDRKLVRQRMKERGVTQSVVCEAVGLTSQSAMSNILNGRREVTAEEARRIYDFLDVKQETQFTIVPLINIASVGRWREAAKLHVGQMPIHIGLASESAFGLEVSDDSMDLLVDDGGWLLIDPAQKELRAGSYYLIKNGDQEAAVKRWQRSPSRFEPVSSNPDHHSFLAPEVDFTVLGRVVWKGAPV